QPARSLPSKSTWASAGGFAESWSFLSSPPAAGPSRDRPPSAASRAAVSKIPNRRSARIEESSTGVGDGARKPGRILGTEAVSRPRTGPRAGVSGSRGRAWLDGDGGMLGGRRLDGARADGRLLGRRVTEGACLHQPGAPPGGVVLGLHLK